MSYQFSAVNFPSAVSGEPSCKEQREAYTAEKMRVALLAEKLGAEAAACHKQHGDYQSAVQARISAEQAGAACRGSLNVWTQAKEASDAALALAKKCSAYLSAKKDWQDYVAKNNASNAAAQAKYESDLAAVNLKNQATSQQNSAMAADHARSLYMWQQRDASYKKYLAAVNAQAYDMSMQWSATQQKYPKETSYQFNHRQYRCNTHMTCMTAEDKQKYAAQCIVVRGLGALPVADICRTRLYYPTCPTTCPTAVANPGTAPVAPVPIAYLATPKAPTFPASAPLEDFLRSKGVEKMPDDCGSWQVLPLGPKPSCTPNPTLPAVPPTPTCTPPTNIPAAPVAPTCKDSAFGQFGPMWLLLAAGVGGLYWYSKKK